MRCENRLRQLEKIINSKTATILFVYLKNGVYLLNGKPVDVDSIECDVLVIDDIPDDIPIFSEDDLTTDEREEVI